jgi:CRP-like cAMP-binding protein
LCCDKAMQQTGGRLAERQCGSAQGEPSRLTNEILANLPDAEFELIRPHLEYHQFARHTALCDPEEPIQYGYFLNSGMASCLIPMNGGGSVEVTLIGKGGFVGNPLLFGVQRCPLLIVVQVPGDGYRMRSEDFERLLPRTPQLFRKIGRHLLLQSMQTAQTAACNRLHSLQQRLARWLLMASDRVGPEFAMTQEYLAQMLGTGRPSVSLTASQMQRAGAIQYARGLVKVVDRRVLERLSCECHSAVQAMMRELELS